MPWFWGSKEDDDEDYDSEEYSDDEYSDKEYSDDDEDVSSGDDEDQDDNSLVNEDDKQAVDGQHVPERSTEEKKDETEATVEKSAGTVLNSGASLLDTDDNEDSEDDDNEGSSSEHGESSDSESDDDDDEEPPSVEANIKPMIQVETVDEDSSSDESDDDSDDDGDENEEVTSFADKQSVLLLAAEHDRVDILKGILTDSDVDKEELMNSGIPPLHVAISFGSTGTTQSLLRMGADPSIRPNVAEVHKQQRAQDSKVEIQNMNRFSGVSAWELAFGNAAFEELQQEGGAENRRWSLFGAEADNVAGNHGKIAIIKPVSMKPSKREGIRHAFTAEALRSISGDEVDRLKQLLDSGMPPSIDIGGKDLYEWAVEMGALKCEELLRPAEALKYANEDEAASSTSTSEASSNTLNQRARVLRPQDTSVLQLRNRLDELESLAFALSTCLDNLAEEVSVCHGLLLMNGGASALASHVKSLKRVLAQKADDLDAAQVEWEASDWKLADLVRTTGEVGQQVMKFTPDTLKSQNKQVPAEKIAVDIDEQESHRRELTAQIAASENKIRKLRNSIADLSEENARDLKEVERRGLSGGIDLVRNLREETRDLEFQLSEVNSNNATCRAKIALIHARMPNFPPKAELAKVTAKPTNGDAVTVAVIGNDEKALSEQIATGDSHAIAVRAPGNQGFFKIDLWQVILRIIGFNRAADRRALEVAQHRQQEPGMAHVMTV